MTASPITSRTAEERAELPTRSWRMSQRRGRMNQHQRQRSVLLLGDGKRTAAEVRRLALPADVTANSFEDSVSAGSIQLAGASPRDSSFDHWLLR